MRAGIYRGNVFVYSVSDKTAERSSEIEHDEWEREE